MIRFEKSKRNLIKIGIGIIVILIVGAGISLAARIWDPLWNPFRPSPEKVIDKMSQKMKEVKTNHSEIKFEFGVKEDTKEAFKMTMGFRVDSDVTDSKNPKSTGDFDMVMTFNGMQISLAGETITIGDVSYFKLTTIPTFPLFEMMGMNFNEMQNQWIKYDEENNLKTKEKEEAMIQKIEALLKDKKLYIVKKEFPDEEIRDVKTYHYLVALNKEEIKKILPELFKIMEEYISPTLFPGEEEIASKLDKFFEKIGEITAEIWIGKKDNYLYKIKGEKEIDLSTFAQNQKGTITIKFDVDSSNFNQPVTIEAPTEYKNFEEILGFLFPSLIEAKASARDARIISDLVQVRVVAEKIQYDFKSYENLCTESPDSTLNEKAPTYGKELADLEENIWEQQLGMSLEATRDIDIMALDLICLDSVTSFCVEANLISVGKGRYCIDNSWKTKEITDDQVCLGTGTAKNPYRCP